VIDSNREARYVRCQIDSADTYSTCDVTQLHVYNLHEQGCRWIIPVHVRHEQACACTPHRGTPAMQARSRAKNKPNVSKLAEPTRDARQLLDRRDAPVLVSNMPLSNVQRRVFDLQHVFAGNCGSGVCLFNVIDMDTCVFQALAWLVSWIWYGNSECVGGKH
jgi:hypothetical protein